MLEIQGNPAVTHQQVNDNIDRCHLGCDNDRHMMQMARLIVTKTSESCLRNFELTCYGEHFSIIFWSGSRQNKFVIQIIQGEIHVDVTGESWRRWFQKNVEEIWNSFKNIVVFVRDTTVDMMEAIKPHTGALVGLAVKAITNGK